MKSLTPVEWLANELGDLKFLKIREIHHAIKLETDTLVINQIFIGKVAEIIGFEKTLELLNESKEAIKNTNK
jgi:hypothetical protein